MKERVTILNELGHIIEEEYHGDASGFVEVDWILWNLGQKEEFSSRPHHRTVTIFY